MPRAIRRLGDVGLIPLNNGREAVIDAADIALAAGRSWMAKGPRGYVRASTTCRGRHITISLHRLIMSAPADVLVDHRDSDPLNNRRSNLRLADARQNAQNSARGRNNSSGFKGAFLDRRTGRWRAMITSNYRQIYLGLFDTAEEAHVAYCRAASQLFGEFARVS